MSRSCCQCGQSFEVTQDDLAFYEKVSPVFGGKKYSILPPALCPDCRQQRRLAWRNEHTISQRSCALCGQEIVSVHAPHHPYPVYCNPCWWSDRWDPLTIEQTYDPSRPFFEQYRELYARVPQRAMVNDDGVTSENSAYTFDVAFAKNCYLCFGMWKVQDCLYCRICDQSRHCIDCEGVKLGSELVYESVDSQHLYHCLFLQNSENCRDCWFGYDLKGCRDCIGCVALRQKQYHIFNEPYAEEEYWRRAGELRLHSRSGIAALQARFGEFIRRFPRKHMNLQSCQECLGDHLFHCRDVLGYVCTNSQHSRWVERSDGPLWCYDCVQCGDPQLCYECVTVDHGYMNVSSLYCNQSKHILYSDNCLSCEHLLGCVSLRRKKYCVLNRQYTKDEYEGLAASIIAQMQQDGSFGEFFPVSLSPYGYNETNAQEVYPLSREEVLRRGWGWENDLPFTTGRETLRQIPDDIREVPDGITHEILACEACRRNYRIVPQELAIYRAMSVPVPAHCPECRNIGRLKRRNPQKLWKRQCAKCLQPIQTTYAPERPETVYCEECYLRAVY